MKNESVIPCYLTDNEKAAHVIKRHKFINASRNNTVNMIEILSVLNFANMRIDGVDSQINSNPNKPKITIEMLDGPDNRSYQASEILKKLNNEKDIILEFEYAFQHTAPVLANANSKTSVNVFRKYSLSELDFITMHKKDNTFIFELWCTIKSVELFNI